MGGPHPPAGREDAEGAISVPYRYENSQGQTYYLHGKEVTLQNGRKQRIFWFAREPKALARRDGAGAAACAVLRSGRAAGVLRRSSEHPQEGLSLIHI